MVKVSAVGLGLTHTSSSDSSPLLVLPSACSWTPSHCVGKATLKLLMTAGGEALPLAGQKTGPHCSIVPPGWRIAFGPRLVAAVARPSGVVGFSSAVPATTSAELAFGTVIVRSADRLPPPL